jgi:mannose-6-phosphate isomerase
VREEASRKELFEAFKAQDYDAVMFRHSIHTGDTVYVPGGILHAFGPDALVFEVQQTSDLGQFVMPEDLYGNRLDEQEWNANIEATLDELKTGYEPRPNSGLSLEAGTNHRLLCCAGPYFAMERWTLRETYREPAHPQRCTTLTNVGGTVNIEYEGGVERLVSGESCVLPAAVGEVDIVPEDEAILVVCYVPDLERDVIGPLREAGYSDDEIQSLGEVGV